MRARNRKEFAMDDWNRIGTYMQDAGCSDAEIARAETAVQKTVFSM